MILEHIKVGINSVRASRFRSFFTILGIVIGVVSVITIISLGEGVKRQISGQVADLGTNIISIKPGNIIKRDSGGKITSVNLFASTGIASLTQKDVESVKTLAGVQAVTPMSTISGLPSLGNKVYTDGVVVSGNADITKVIDHKIEFGTYIRPEEESQKMAVIGPDIAEKLFNEAVPIGKTVTIRGQQFTVEGVFSSFSNAPITTGIDLNKAVFISSTMAHQLLGSQPPIYEILVKYSKDADPSRIVENIQKVIKQNHDGQDDFTVLDKEDSKVASDELVKMITKMIVGMAGITLVIGGIGIMNVMLVSVSERRHEIGIRKAIGATDRQIRNQFILESAILSVWGVIFGIVIAGLLNIVLRIVTDLEPVLLPKPILLSGLVAALVGIIFGSVPAIKASQKDPIESLRS